MAEYLIVHPENGWIFELPLFMISVHRRCAFVRCPEHLWPHRMDHRWIIKVSILMIKILKLFAKPMASVGIWIEFTLNFLSQNGGILRILSKIIKGGIIIPKRDTETFISAIGHLDERLDLEKLGISEGVNEDASSFTSVEAGSRYCADISIMASKLSYENELVIRNVVTERWKMHFVKFFNCWNQYLGKKSTQAFIFCDKPVNAKLVVVAFRGTEPFDADDWRADFDFSWYKMDPIGRAHMGFLEALGMFDRSNTGGSGHHIKFNNNNDNDNSNVNHDLEISSGWPQNVIEDDEKPLAYYAVRNKLSRLLAEHKNAKFILTGHSLGGALAVLFPAILFLHGKISVLEKLLAVYTFGQPRVGDQEMGNFMNLILNQPVPRYFRVVYCNDIVPRLPYDNKTFLFKHFGVCLYYNSCYREQNLREEPNRNFSFIYFLSNWINAMWELIQGLTLGYRKGEGFKECWFSIFFRFIGLFLPGLSAHSPVNYVNAIRLGPSVLSPTLAQEDSELSLTVRSSSC